MRRWGVAFVVACAMGCPSGWAQGLRTLEPSAFWVVGDRFDIHVGLDGKPDDGARLRWAFVRCGQRQENAVTLAGLGKGLLEELSLFGVDMEPVFETVPSDWIVPSGVLGSRKVRRVQSAAALVRTASGDPIQSAIAVSKSGLAAEIRPLLDPSAPREPSSGGARPEFGFPVRLYVEGAALKGAVAEATHDATGARVQAQTDAEGIASLRLDRGGRWTVAFHHYRAADRTLFTGTLRFEVRR